MNDGVWRYNAKRKVETKHAQHMPINSFRTLYETLEGHFLLTRVLYIHGLSFFLRK